MDPLTVRLELPRDLLSALDVSEEELLDQSKEAFVGLLKRKGVPYFTETPGELTRQVAEVEQKFDAAASS